MACSSDVIAAVPGRCSPYRIPDRNLLIPKHIAGRLTDSSYAFDYLNSTRYASRDGQDMMPACMSTLLIAEDFLQQDAQACGPNTTRGGRALAWQPPIGVPL